MTPAEPAEAAPPVLVRTLGANAGPNTNGSQFFFCWKDTTLPPLYTPFGTVIGGMDVLQKIAAAGDDSQNGPGDGYPNRFTEFRSVQIKVTH